MFFKDLKLKSNVTLKVSLAQAHLPVRMGHADANAVFAEPLTAQLAAAGLGTVMECKPHPRDSGDVRGVDLFLGLTDASKRGMQTVASMLEQLAAPCGSSLRLTDGISDPLIFGRAEGLELAVDIAATPDTESRSDLATMCCNALSPSGVSRGWHATREHALFYFYGNDLARMRDNLTRVLRDHPELDGAMLRRLA